MAKRYYVPTESFGSSNLTPSANKRAELCNEIKESFSGDIRSYIINFINNICDIELIAPTKIRSFTNLDDFFKVAFELEHLQNPDKSNIVSNFTESVKNGNVDIIAIKFISYIDKNYNDINELCIYYDNNSDITISELLELYHEYIRKEIFLVNEKGN